MKRYMQIVMMLTGSLFLNNLNAAAYNKTTISIKTMKHSFSITTCDAATTIKQIKYKIQDREGIPVNQQKLLKAEWLRIGWIIPEKTQLELEDDKTCAYYDIKDKAVLTLWLKRVSHR